MNQESDDLIRERVEATAETINGLDPGELAGVHLDTSIPEIEPLDVTAEVNLHGDVAGSIVLVLATGGPHIELDATDAQVHGYWGGAEHVEPVAQDVCDEIERYYRQRFEETVLA